jgi:hypothetical protein
VSGEDTDSWKTTDWSNRGLIILMTGNQKVFLGGNAFTWVSSRSSEEDASLRNFSRMMSLCLSKSSFSSSFSQPVFNQSTWGYTSYLRIGGGNRAGVAELVRKIRPWQATNPDRSQPSTCGRQ